MLHARRDYDPIQDSRFGADEPVFLVRAKDNAFVPTLEAWRDEHLSLGGDPALAVAIDEHIRKAREWRERNLEKLKVADAPAGTLRIPEDECFEY